MLSGQDDQGVERTGRIGPRLSSDRGPLSKRLETITRTSDDDYNVLSRMESTRFTIWKRSIESTPKKRNGS